jgi:DNA adenine methylase
MESIRVEPLPGLVAWFGGKRNLAPRLAALFERIPHACYAEPFVGMGGVFLRRRRRPDSEAINDLGRDVANLFRIVRHHPDALFREMEWAITARAEHARQRAVDPATLTDVQRAARFFYLQAHAYGGLPRGVFITSPLRKSRFDPRRAKRLLRLVHRRLVGVHIDCLPYQDFMARWDRPTTLFYLDPPYWGREREYGDGLFERADFERLAGILARLDGVFFLSLNDTPGVRRIFSRFRTREVATTYRVRGAQRVTELLITNWKGSLKGL